MLLVFDFDGTLALHFGGSAVLRTGAEETLETLARADFSLAVLTNRDEADAVVILEELGILDLFEVVSGASEGRAQKPDPGPLLEICDYLGIPAGRTIMIGDSETDHLCAEAAGAAFIGITGGFSVLTAPVVVEGLAEILDLFELDLCPM